MWNVLELSAVKYVEYFKERLNGNIAKTVSASLFHHAYFINTLGSQARGNVKYVFDINILFGPKYTNVAKCNISIENTSWTSRTLWKNLM